MKKFNEMQLAALNKLFDLDIAFTSAFRKYEADKDNQELKAKWEKANIEFAHYRDAYEAIGLVTPEDYDNYYDSL